jgi:hypothetical protein
MSIRPLIGAGALLLIAASALLWRAEQAPAPREPVRVVRSVAPAVAPASAAASAAARPASSLVAPAMAASSASAAAPADPFRAFLQRANDGRAATPASAAAAPSPDPFKAALEAGRRPAAVPLVSPFGAQR